MGTILDDVVIITPQANVTATLRVKPAYQSYLPEIICSPVINEDHAVAFRGKIEKNVTGTAGRSEYQVILTDQSGKAVASYAGSFNVSRGIMVDMPEDAEELENYSLEQIYTMLSNVTTVYNMLVNVENVIGMPNEELETTEKTLISAINELKTAIAANAKKVQEHDTKIADHDRSIAAHGTQIEANKNAIGVNKNAIEANAALSASNKTRIDAIDAQVKSIARTFAVKTFGEFIQFINGNISVTLYEDRNADGATEAYSVTVGDLITGDSVLIVEEEVPDFWFEKTTDISGAGTYFYNGTEYSLAAKQGNKDVGIWHATETDLSEVKEASEIAVAAANRAEAAAKRAEDALVMATAVDLSRYEDEGVIVETMPDNTTRTTTFEFDENRRPVKITDGDGNETVLTW
jgi:hypothetical protein